ncbi:MAG TPA: NAD(P)-binding domain-containing protein, partial [Kofleriaceae bacterium]|nr:NAD(P)-binding domain-containing protein [Kofleriaceae bacterium]
MQRHSSSGGQDQRAAAPRANRAPADTRTGVAALRGGHMKIGIVGTGHMGRTLGVRWAQAGHSVLFGSRDPENARRAARQAGAPA